MNTIKTIGLAFVAMIAVLSARAQSLPQDGLKLIEDTASGPWGVAGGYGHSVTGIGNNVAFEVVSYDLMPSTNSSIPGFASGPIVGFDQLWSGGRKSLNSIGGGWDASYTGKPLTFVGKSFLTNVTATVMAYQLVATPRGSGSIGAITGTAVSVDTGVQWQGFHLKALGLYESRNGQTGFNGNYLLGGIAVTHDF